MTSKRKITTLADTTKSTNHSPVFLRHPTPSLSRTPRIPLKSIPSFNIRPITTESSRVPHSFDQLSIVSAIAETLEKSSQLQELIDMTRINQSMSDELFDKHFIALYDVLSSLDSHNVKLNPDKINLFFRQVDFLGFRISKDQRSIAPERAQGFLEWPQPTTCGQLHSFVASLRFFATHFPNFETEVNGLDEMHRGQPKHRELEWTAQQTEQFKKVRGLAAKHLIRNDIDFSKPLRVMSDASGGTKGTSLSQRGGMAGMLYQLKYDDDPNSEKIIIAFYSKMLTEAQSDWHTLDQEALALILTLEKFEHLFGSHQVIASTDHINIVHLVRNLYLTTHSRTMRMIQRLTQYNLILQHVKGKENFTDLASRSQVASIAPFDSTGCPISHACNALFEKVNFQHYQPPTINTQQINFRELAADEIKELSIQVLESELHALNNQVYVQPIGSASSKVEHRRTADNQQQRKFESQCECRHCEQWHETSRADWHRIAAREDRKETFTCKDVGRVCHPLPRGWTEQAKNHIKDRPSPAECAKLKLTLFEAFQFGHNQLRGHLKTEELLTRIREEFPQLEAEVTRKKVDDFVKGCPHCQKQAKHNFGRQSHPGRSTSANEMLQHFAMDHVQITSKPDKFGNMYMLAFIDMFSRNLLIFPCQGTTAKEAARHLTTLALRFGIPKTLNTDKGTAFTSDLFQEFLELMSLGVRYANTAHPQAIGQVERSHQGTLEAIKTIIGRNKSIADEWSIHSQRIEAMINGKFHSAIGMKPIDLMYAGQVDNQSGQRFGDDNLPPLKDKSREYHDMVKELKSRVKYFDKNASKIVLALKRDALAFQERAQENITKADERRHSTKSFETTQEYKPNDLILIRDTPMDKTKSPWKGPVQVIRHDRKSSTVTYDEIARDTSNSIHMDRTKPFRNTHGLTLLQLQSIAGHDHNLFVPMGFQGAIMFPENKERKAKNATIMVDWLEGESSVHPAIDFKANPTFRKDVLAKEEQDVQNLFRLGPNAKTRPAVQRRKPGQELDIDYDAIPAIGEDAENNLQPAVAATLSAVPATTAELDAPVTPTSIDESVAKARNETKPNGIALRGKIAVVNTDSSRFSAKCNVNVLIDTGCNAVDCISNNVALHLLKEGATSFQDGTKLVAFNGSASTANEKIKATLHLSFVVKDLEITSTFVVAPSLTTDVIIGDQTLARANLLTSPIKEIQDLLDQAAASSYAQVSVNSLQEFEESLLLTRATQPPSAADFKYSSREHLLAKLQLEYNNKLFDLKLLDSNDFDEDSLPKPHVLPDFVNTTSSSSICASLRMTSDKLLTACQVKLQALCNSAYNTDAAFAKINDALTPRQSLLARALVANFQQVFACTLGSSLKNLPDMEIRRKEEFKDKQIWCYPRPTTPETRAIIKSQLAEMLAAGVIRRSKAPICTSPVHIVRHKDKKARFTIGQSLFISPFTHREHPSAYRLCFRKKTSSRFQFKSTPQVKFK